MSKLIETKLMILENFITYMTTDDAERNQLFNVADDYVLEDHVNEIEQHLDYALRLIEVNTTAWEEENFKLVTTLSDRQIESVIKPIVDKERDGGSNYTNNDLFEALTSAYPTHIVSMYESINIIKI